MYALTCSQQLGSLRFDAAAQERFAALSGDFNPMHMDPQAARRTVAGQRVVHGMNILLQTLDRLAETGPLPPIKTLVADFKNFLALEEVASIWIVRQTNTEIGVSVRAGELPIAHFVIGFVPPISEEGTQSWPDVETIFDPAHDAPHAPEWDDIANTGGAVRFSTGETEAALTYPDLSAVIAPASICALLAMTRLVGMISPGVHSVFHKLDIVFGNYAGIAGQLHFKPGPCAERFQMASFTVRARGLAGTIMASRRSAPVRQLSCFELRGLVSVDAFAGQTSMVVGASRGLGELTAKLLGVGGANVIITYFAGAENAQDVARDIIRSGGTATALRLNVLCPIDAQLASLETWPDAVYYYATPSINGRAGGSADNFRAFYVDAFAQLCAVMRSRKLSRTRFFYPSSIFVDNAPSGMVAYAAAKAEGEKLAADISATYLSTPVFVVRLPRLPTDQSGGLIAHDLQDAVVHLLPIVNRLQKGDAQVLSEASLPAPSLSCL